MIIIVVLLVVSYPAY
ncbi:hypothetical protein [Escherichia coli]